MDDIDDAYDAAVTAVRQRAALAVATAECGAAVIGWDRVVADPDPEVSG